MFAHFISSFSDKTPQNNWCCYAIFLLDSTHRRVWIWGHCRSEHHKCRPPEKHTEEHHFSHFGRRAHKHLPGYPHDRFKTNRLLSPSALQFQFPFIKYRSLKFADRTEAPSSADVRMVTRGHVTSVSRTGDVTMTQTRVGALEVSPQMDNSASQYTFGVSFTPYLKCLTNYLVAMISCMHMMSPTKVCFGFFPKDFSTCPPPTGKTCKALVDAVLVSFQSCVLFGFPVFAAPPVLHEYLISVELNVSDAAALTQLKTALNGSAYPIRLNGSIQVSSINITTGTGRTH